MKTLMLSALLYVLPMQAAPPLWGGLVPGAYQVGYERLGRAGGLVHVWYPARAAGTRLTVREYVRADSSRMLAFLASAKVSDPTAQLLLRQSLYASASEKALDGEFPLVLVAQGNGQDVFDQVVLCEYLASYGFVVATTPSPMIRTPMTSDNQVGQMAAIQATQLSIAIHTVSTAHRIDVNRIGVVGHSFGARGALLLAMNNSKIKAIVSLDGGIGTATAAESFRKAPSFSAVTALPPLLHLYETLDDFMAPDFALLRSLHFQSVTLTPVEGMHHIHFTSYGSAAALFPDLAALTRATAATRASVVKTHDQTRDFLKKYLSPK